LQGDQIQARLRRLRGQPLCRNLTLSPQAQGTQIEWALDGDFGGSIVNQVMSRYFSLLMAQMMVDDFDRGLANLKKLSESCRRSTSCR